MTSSTVFRKFFRWGWGGGAGIRFLELGGVNTPLTSNFNFVRQFCTEYSISHHLIRYAVWSKDLMGNLI